MQIEDAHKIESALSLFIAELRKTYPAFRYIMVVIADGGNIGATFTDSNAEETIKLTALGVASLVNHPEVMNNVKRTIQKEREAVTSEASGNPTETDC